MKASGFITAGGRSSRMGRDKAWLELGGRAMIEHVMAALKPVTSTLAIIANDREYTRLGLPVFQDSRAGIGPLEAIRTALANSQSPLVVLVGCDLPFVTAELFSFLLDQAPGFDAVVPVGADGRVEPLCAVYSTSSLDKAASLIESGERKVVRLFERVSTRLVHFDEFWHLGGAKHFFENINTPEEYARAIGLFDSGADGG